MKHKNSHIFSEIPAICQSVSYRKVRPRRQPITLLARSLFLLKPPSPSAQPQPIGRAADTPSPSVQNMDVDHPRTQMYLASMDHYGPPALTCCFQNRNDQGRMPAGRPQRSDYESRHLEEALRYPPLRQTSYFRKRETGKGFQVQGARNIAVRRMLEGRCCS